MSTLPLLIEIGVEEIPDWMIQPAVANFRELVTGLLGETAWAARFGWRTRRRGASH